MYSGAHPCHTQRTSGCSDGRAHGRTLTLVRLNTDRWQTLDLRAPNRAKEFIFPPNLTKKLWNLDMAGMLCFASQNMARNNRLTQLEPDVIATENIKTHVVWNSAQTNEYTTPSTHWGEILRGAFLTLSNTGDSVQPSLLYKIFIWPFIIWPFIIYMFVILSYCYHGTSHNPYGANG